MLFSQRKGLKPIKSIIQIDALDEELRNALWSAVTVWRSHHSSGPASAPYALLMKEFWLFYFKKPLDAFPDANSVFSHLRKIFFDGEWYECYDILEFIISKYPVNEYREELINGCNEALERELSAYRFVGNQITQITSDAEMSAIEEALADSQRLRPVNEHLATALTLIIYSSKIPSQSSINPRFETQSSIMRRLKTNFIHADSGSGSKSKFSFR